MLAPTMVSLVVASFTVPLISPFWEKRGKLKKEKSKKNKMRFIEERCELPPKGLGAPSEGSNYCTESFTVVVLFFANDALTMYMPLARALVSIIIFDDDLFPCLVNTFLPITL